MQRDSGMVLPPKAHFLHKTMDFSQPGVPQMAAVIRGKEPVTSISFHSSGKHLFVASQRDSRLRVIDCDKGTSDQPAIRFEREGIRLVESTHCEDCVLIAGCSDHNIYYHSLYDNKILRQFRGHDEDVTNISMCPANDQFLSSAKDGSVRLWTLQEAGCVAKMELPEGAKGAYGVFDGSGLVFGIAASGSSEDYIHLYDARNYTTGAFGEFKILHSSVESVIQKQDGFSGSASALSNKPLTSLAFNASGNQLLATGEDGLALLLDGFEGTIQKSLCSTGSISACFTPDDKTVLMGNKDGTISCWSIDSGKPVKHLGGHTGRVGCIAANPTKEQFASSCTSTALWLW